MRSCNIEFQGIAPLSQSRPLSVELESGETMDQAERRVWRDKAHVEAGRVLVPQMGFKQSLDKAAQMLGLKMAGRRGATYTKYFLTGCLIVEPAPVADAKALREERVYVSGNGKRGVGTRVWKSFPVVDEWQGIVRVEVFAEEIPREVFEQVAQYAGRFVGVGRFRPENGGYFGRFECLGFEWA